jgi:hypothetical protein
MNRITGSTTVSLNVDVLASGPWDARSIIPFFSGLTDNQTLPYPYAGMVVTVYNDSDETKNGIYYCSNKGGNIEFADGTSEWVRAGGGDGTLTGGTVVNNRISGATSSGFTSYFGEVVAVTGGTYNNGTITLSGSGSLSNITGFNVLSGTGVDSSYNTTGIKLDAVQQILEIKLNNGTSISANTAAFTSDNYVYSGTYNSGTGTVTFYPITGGSFDVSGWPTQLANYYTTGSTYDPNQGIITFNRTDLQPAYSATGFNYVTGFTVNPSNTISGYTNISGASVAYGGVINAVTGGTFLNGTLLFSGTGNILSGVTITGLTDNYTTGSTYNASTGIINFSGAGSQPQYSATGFNYVTGFTVSSANTISGYTNISGSTVAFGGTINAVTGGSFSNNTLYLSGTGNILSGISITGFSTQVGGSVYTGGTSTAGTGGTTNITGTLIESGQTTGVTFSLSGALSFTNSNLTKREVGGIGDGSNFFSSGKTLQEIIQQIFYPVDAPTITNIGKTLTKGGALIDNLYIVGTTGSVVLNATYTSGTSVTTLGTKRTGPVSSFVFSGYTQPSPAVTGFTTNSTTAYTVNSNYSVVKGYNTWTCDINYSIGEQPVYDDGNPYYGTGVNQFIQAGTVTPSNVTIEGVYPVSATTTTGNLSIFTQQTLVSMITNTALTITLAAENSSSFRQSFILPQDLDTRFSSLGLFNSLTGNYDPVTILSLFDRVSYGNLVIGGDTVAYYRYTYKIPDLTGQSIYKLTFS